MKRDINIFSFLLTVLLVFSSAGWAETIFDSFDSEPTSRGWTKSETGGSSFTWLDDLIADTNGNKYVAGGYIKANMKRAPESDRLSVALSQSYDQGQEFWVEFDMRTTLHYQYERAMVGLFNSTNGNLTNALAAKVFRQQTSGSSSPKNARFNSYESAGANVYVDPGFVYDKLVPVRIKLHYSVDGNGNGIGEVEIWHLNQVGASDDDKLVSASDILFANGSGKTAVYDVLGIGNLPGSVSSYWQGIWTDNMYVSTEQDCDTYFTSLGSLRPEPAFGTYSQDLTAPTPDPMTWSSAPAAISPTKVTMTATAATDDSGVRYYFENIDDPNRNSGWQDGTSWTDARLDDDTTYSYHVKVQDLSANRNETAWSASAAVTTPVETDVTAPTPDPLTWSSAPALFAYKNVTMTANTATDGEGNGPVDYYFSNLTDPTRDSGWQLDTEYTDEDLDYATAYSYAVKARDISANYNETGSSLTVMVTTDAEPPISVFERKSMMWHANKLDTDCPMNIYYKETSTGGLDKPVIVYVMNHGYPRIGQEADASILADMIDEDYIVITVDFNNNTNAVSPYFDKDLHDIYKAVYGIEFTSLLQDINLIPSNKYACYFIPAGNRIIRNQVYFELDKHGSYGTKEQVMSTYNSYVVPTFGVDPVTDPDDMITPAGSPLDYKLRMDVIYPSQPTEDLPLMFWNGTTADRKQVSTPSKYRIHFGGLAMRGYAVAVIDHCWNPLARRDAYGYFSSYTLEDWNGLKSATAAMRFIHMNANAWGIDATRIGGVGHSKGTYTLTRLSDPNHESPDAGEYFTFSGFPEDTPEPQPWQGYSSQITCSAQSAGNGTRRTSLVTSENVPTLVACGKYDEYNQWVVFPKLVGTYEGLDLNHQAFWMVDRSHELPYGYNTERDCDMYTMWHAFFDAYLKPGTAPEVMYINPRNSKTAVGVLTGYSSSIPESSLLPDDAYDYVSPTDPITVSFAPAMDPSTIVAGSGIEVVKVSDDSPVAGSWTGIQKDSTFIFTPAGHFEENTAYRITVTTNVKSDVGVNLEEAKVSGFTTGLYETTTPTSFTPAPGVVHNGGTLSVTWIAAPTYTGTYGTDFVVETSTTLDGDWSPVTEGDGVTVAEGEVTYTSPSPAGKLFVRLSVTGP
jgi:hypothetical protein